ncbi:LysR family transcriptional regulator [Kribbella sp. NPDC051770]|uniref:LysR family transcriptional regulator n=1 Tax=Kribbella sp. NPDC051770 TaxID=3155413 RepID=UPI00342F890E
MERVETRELEYFVAVAEELHFGRASDRLGIAQPPLSRAISRLERRLGVQLFERTSRRVALTDAGTTFLTQSRKALRAVDTAVLSAQRTGRPHRLVIATRPGVGPGLLANTLRAYRRQPGAAEVQVIFTQDPLQEVHTGTADVALICGRNDLTDLTTTEIAEEQTVALLPTDHPLAARPFITTHDITTDPTYRPACAPTDTLDQLVEEVSLGHRIVTVGATATTRTGPLITAVPVIDAPTTHLVLAWHPETPPTTRTSFTRTTQSTAAPHPNLLPQPAATA